SVHGPPRRSGTRPARGGVRASVARFCAPARADPCRPPASHPMSDQHQDPPGDDPDERARLLADEAAKRKRAGRNLRRRQRYAEDEEFRGKMLTAHREWWAANFEELNAQRRKRRADDPEFRDKANRKNRGERGRNNTLKWRYGLTLADYNAMLARQNGV